MTMASVWLQAMTVAVVVWLAQAPPAGAPDRSPAPAPAATDNSAAANEAAQPGVPGTTVAASNTNVPNESLKTKLDDTLNRMNDPIAFIVLAVAVVSLSWGWRFYRVLVVIGGFCVGAVSGNLVAEATAGQVSQSGNYPLIMSLVSGSAFGALAVPYLRTGLFLIVGLTGAYAMFIAAQAINPGWSLGFAVGGFVICGIIATMFFQIIIVIGTSLIGGVAAVCGALYWVRKYQPASYEWVLVHSALLPAAALAIAVLGIAIQFQIAPKEGPHVNGATPKPKPDGKSGAGASGDGHRTGG